MKPRIDYAKAGISQKGIQHINGLAQHVRQSLDEKLLHLINIRASQINGCAFCLDMHTQEAQYSQEDRRRINTVATWHESPWFSEKERAALAWTEAVTLLAQTHVPDNVYEQVKEQFTEAELIDLTLAVITINSWNRLAVSFRTTPGAMDEYIRQQYEGRLNGN